MRKILSFFIFFRVVLKIFSMMIENYDIQLSSILYIDRTTGLEIGYNSSKLFPVLLYPVFFIARFSNARPLFFCFPPSWPPTARGFSFSSCFILFLKWRGEWMEKTSFLLFFVLIFFLEEMEKGIGREVGFNFDLFSWISRNNKWRENSSIFSFPSSLLKEKRKKKMKKNRRVRLLSLGFLFEKEVGEERE